MKYPSIPYMGNKQKYAQKIYDAILNDLPAKQERVLVDLFCGGFSISSCFKLNGWQVISNDKNKYVIALLDKVLNQELDIVKCLEWISCKQFKDITDNPQKYQEWYVGYVLCVWSFGNNGRHYLFGKAVEEYKRQAHEFIVFGIDNKKYLQEYCMKMALEKYGTAGNLELKNLVGATVKDRRLEYRKQLGVWNKIRMADNEQLEQLEQLQQLQQLEGLERLEQLERLQQLQQLQQLETVALTSFSYDKVTIPDNAVIYLDPPYFKTQEYKEGGFDHTKFWDWVRHKSTTHKVYVSEYNAPDDFELILKIETRSTLSARSNICKSVEKLFRIKK